MHSEQINEIAAALSKAQGSMGAAAKDKNNPFYKSKYADFHAMWSVYQKPLADNSLSLSQGIVIENGIYMMETLLLHGSGQWIKYQTPLSYDPKMTPQQVGSLFSYYKRYCVSAILGLAICEDDDAEKAMEVYRQEPKVEASVYKSSPKEMSYTNPNSNASEKQIAFIERLIGGDDAKLKSVLDHFKITDIKNISRTQANPIIDFLKGGV